MEVAVDNEHGAVVGELPPVVGRAEERQQPALRKAGHDGQGGLIRGIVKHARPDLRTNLRKVLEAVVDALVRAYDKLEPVCVAEGAHAVGAELHRVGAASIGQHALEAVTVRGV